MALMAWAPASVAALWAVNGEMPKFVDFAAKAGLKDVFYCGGDTANKYTSEALLTTVREAIRVFHDRTLWQTLMRNGMMKDFSWNASAREYVKVYERVRQLQAAPFATA